MYFRSATLQTLLGPLSPLARKNAPKAIHYSGNPDVLHAGPRVSVIGSRKASGPGLARSRRLAALLVQRGMTVVSGLAEGIDTAAHTQAIASGGKTIAVIGTPLDRCYPRENTELQHTIMRDHLCLSQFPSGHRTTPDCFPMRNRTMALISDATVIIEAAGVSGALSQAAETLRLRRPLYVVKSVVDDQRLKWPAEMLAKGAKILSDETVEQFLDSLPLR